MANKDLIAVIEIGSSTVTGAVGYRRPDGVFEVKACASEPSGEFIKNGVVRNIDKTAQCLTNIVNRLDGQLRTATIEQVYVGLCGYTVHSVGNTVEHDFGSETRITSDIIDSMAEKNLQGVSSDRVVVKSIPQEYFGDGIQMSDPVGCNCSQLSGHYLNLEARYSTMENFRAAFEAAKLFTADEYITPLVLADAVLLDRSLGCALVDIGAGTTTVSVYKGNHLRYLSVIPLGDRAIISDLVSLGIATDEAEEIRRKYGLSIKTDDSSTYVTRSGNHLKMNDIGFAIRARFHEIIENVEHQIRQAGYDKDDLKSGFVFTGGAMEMPEAEAYVCLQPFFVKMHVAQLLSDIEWEAQEKPAPSKQIILAALLNNGTEPCCEEEQPEEQPAPAPAYTMGSLFDEEGNSAQEERDREEAERQEAKRKKQEEEQKKREEKRRNREKKSLFDRVKEYLTNELLSE